MSNQKNKLNLQVIKKSKRFDFIKDEELREELYLSFYYVTYLGKEINENNCDYIIYSMKHTIILYIGAQIEAVLMYFVSEYFKNTKNESALKKYCEIISYIEKKGASARIGKQDYVFCEKNIKNEKFRDDINFKKLINGAKDHKIISNEILNIINNIREKRNSIHTKVLMNFKKENIAFNDLEEIFNDGKKIFDYFDALKI